MKDIIQNFTLKQKIVFSIILLIIILIIFYGIYKYFYASKNTKDEINVQSITNEIANEIIEPTAKIGLKKEPEKIIIHIIGEIKKPGIVTLKQGARIKDAIEQAGGATVDADLSKVNLAYMLEDGLQIYIPSIATNEINIDYISSEAGEGIITDAPIDNDKKTTIININTATIEQLTTLPGIGISTAQKIIEYREEKGKFKTIEELKEVPGIGESKYQKLEQYIKV